MEKIKIAVDSCIIIRLSRIINDNLTESDKAVMDCLKSKTLTPDLYKNIPYKFLPPILKDKFLGHIETNEEGRTFYNNLLDIYHLWEMIEKGRCELYITPTVFGELDFEWFEQQLNFINKYVNVVQVSDENATKFYRDRDNLAWEYIRNGAMIEEYNATVRTRVPQNDAYIMAEASLCGLMLVTINNKDFINYNNFEEDYQRVDIIKQVNKDFGLTFYSNINNYKTEPQPFSLNAFVMRTRYRKNGRIRPYCITNPRIENNEYKNDLTK